MNYFDAQEKNHKIWWPFLYTFIFWRTEVSSFFLELELIDLDIILSPHLIISRIKSYPGFPGEFQFMQAIPY